MFAENGTKTLFVSFLISILFLGGFFGISHPGMDMSMDGEIMIHCPFMPGVVICNMSPLQHMTAAKNAFTAIPLADIASLLLLMLIAAQLASLLVHKILGPFFVGWRRISIFTTVPVFADRPLQEAFSNGILHSKAF